MESVRIKIVGARMDRSDYRRIAGRYRDGSSLLSVGFVAGTLGYR